MARRDSEPRITILIPTKDRGPYLHHTLRTCIQQDYDNLEVVVADDGSTDNTREVVAEASRVDPRIRYATLGEPAGMLDNFEFALDQAKDGFVLALGGDDGLMPHGVRDMWDTLRAADAEMLTWPSPAYFYAGTRTPTAQLILHARRGRPYSQSRMVDARVFLERQARELSYVSDIESPMFYVKGLVSTALVNRVRSRTPGGRFYACATPDGYSGIVLAGEVERYPFSGQPFTLHGVSPTSAGVSYLAANDRARAQSESFFRSAAKRPMHRELGSQPYSPLISLMTADYLLTARDLPGWPGTFSELDFPTLLRKGLAELQDGQFAADRVGRELAILHGVAVHRGLGEQFRGMVRKATRNARRPLEGDAVSPHRIYLDATALGIRDVFDASHFAYAAHRSAGALSFEALRRAAANSIHYRMLGAREGLPFPPESEWLRGTSAP